jgi:hypothetical protein
MSTSSEERVSAPDEPDLPKLSDFLQPSTDRNFTGVAIESPPEGSHRLDDPTATNDESVPVEAQKQFALSLDVNICRSSESMFLVPSSERFASSPVEGCGEASAKPTLRIDTDQVLSCTSERFNEVCRKFEVSPDMAADSAHRAPMEMTLGPRGAEAIASTVPCGNAAQANPALIPSPPALPGKSDKSRPSNTRPSHPAKQPSSGGKCCALM